MRSSSRSATATTNDAASIVQTQLFHRLLNGISTHDIMIAQEQKLQNDDICVLRVLKPKPSTQANDHYNNGGGDKDQEENMLEHGGDWGAYYVKIKKDSLYERESLKNEGMCKIVMCISPPLSIYEILFLSII
jgi:hypothetical protein